jgi:histidinol-phosphate aminotransferase
MPEHPTRRLWLKQTAFVLAGLGIKTDVFAVPNYLSPPADDMILLNSNENAYGPSPLARKAIMEHYQKSNRYPDDYIPLLKKKIAVHWNVQPENILLGAGSSEIIGLVNLYLSSEKGTIVTAEPSYRVWNGQAEAFGLQFNRIALNDERKIDLTKMLSAIDNNTRMIYFCNPNNPTGTHVEIATLSDHAIAAAQKTFVLIDEAYTEYAGLGTVVPLAIKTPNIVVAKTFSKVYGLAGARVGYAIGHPDTIRRLGRLQPWPDANVSLVSAAAAMASLDDKEFVTGCKDKVAQSRQLCYDAFKDLTLDYIPSSTNFILFNIDKIKGDFVKLMQAKNIYVQFREHFGGKWCRVSMGTGDEMQQFVKALKEIAG